MENKNYDLKLAGYIWSILKTQPFIVMSWGVDMNTIKPVEEGPEFHVQGFIHTGTAEMGKVDDMRAWNEWREYHRALKRDKAVDKLLTVDWML